MGLSPELIYYLRDNTEQPLTSTGTVFIFKKKLLKVFNFIFVMVKDHD